MYSATLTTLIYVYDRIEDKVLMILKNRDKSSIHFGKYNGLGGKLEKEESLIQGMKRELYEEAGIEPTTYKLKGTINWPEFGKNGENVFGFIFLVTDFNGKVKENCKEGELVWVERNDIFNLNLWDSDKYFLDSVFDDSLNMFNGVMLYKDNKVVSFEIS